MQKNKMIIISAPSGAGKTTIVKKLLKQKTHNLTFSISACSRPKRKNEIHEKDYYFISVNEFKQKIKNNEFIEWEEVYHNQFYGTLHSEIKKIWKNGKNVVFDVDVVGGLNIKKQFPKEALSIFIKPPSINELKNRLINRSTDTKANIIKRINKAEKELQYENKFDAVIINDNLQEAIKNTKQIIADFLLN